MRDHTRQVRAAVLAIGTELTTGQILNRNAAWISSKLEVLGIETVLHLTVADDRSRILQALENCASQAEVLVITGGLGPTTDDFTRDVVSRWCGKPLSFDPSSWDQIKQRLTGFGVPVAESNRQQCYFPEGSKILINAQGTANAFHLTREKTHLWVLPGPPREVEAVWPEVETELRALHPHLPKRVLFTWQCLGKSEAELGELTEAALQGSPVQTGYRAHRPFVEVKAWIPEAALESARPYLQKLEAAIAPWIHSKQGEDLILSLLKELKRSEEIEVIDGGTGGILADRFGAALRRKDFEDLAASFTIGTEWASSSDPGEWVSAALEQADEEVITLLVSGFSPSGTCAIGLKAYGRIHVVERKSPWKGDDALERRQRYLVELAIKQWRDWLTASTH